MGNETFQTSLYRVWNRFIPNKSQVSIYHNYGVVNYLRRSSVTFQKYPPPPPPPPPLAFYRLSHCRHPNKEMARICRAFIISSTERRCTPSTKIPVTCIYKYIKHNCTGIDLPHLCVTDYISRVAICTQTSINSNASTDHVIRSVNYDTTGLCDAMKKLFHAQCGINRSQALGASLTGPGVLGNQIPYARMPCNNHTILYT